MPVAACTELETSRVKARHQLAIIVVAVFPKPTSGVGSVCSIQYIHYLHRLMQLSPSGLVSSKIPPTI